MRAFFAATRRFLAEIAADAMLAAVAVVPLVIGAVFRFGVPALEAYLCRSFGQAAILAPYYPLFDLVLCIVTPVMLTSAGALVMLDEADAGLFAAYAVTPLGRAGYVASRIGVPAVASMVYAFCVTLGFGLSGMGALRIALIVPCAGLMSAVVALIINAFAKNKVEGMAYAKLSGLLMLGIPGALLIPAPYKYALGLLPTLWLTDFVMGGGWWLWLPALAAAGVLVAGLGVRLARRWGVPLAGG